MAIEFFPIPFLIGLALIAAWLVFLVLRRASKKTIFFSAVFGIYLLIVVRLVLFPIYTAYVKLPITIYLVRRILAQVDLRLFQMGGQFNEAHLIDNVYLHALGNLLLTVPFGFLINFIARLRTKDFIWLSIVVGVSTELSQLLVSIYIARAAYRSVDINDALLNILGVWLGYGLYRLFWRKPVKAA